MDRISNLPDELLGHIISNLKTKQAISTCVLSKRWEKVWLNLENLDFYFPSTSPNRPSVVLDFVLDPDFIDETIRRLKSPEIGRFRFFYKSILAPGVVSRWINDAVRLNAYEIDFSVCVMQLPVSFFNNCDKLTVLKLFSNVCDLVTIPEVCCFPNLKSIEFRVSYPRDELTKNLFRSCPKLENLVISGNIRDGPLLEYYDISCLSLKVLDIRLRSFKNFGPIPKVILNVPKIEYLHIDNDCVMEYEVQGPFAPIDASITVRNCCEKLNTEQDGNCAYAIVNGINGAKSLVLNIATTYVLSKHHINNLPTFQHLTCLELGISRFCGWNILFSILENSPNLEDLTIQKACIHYEFFSRRVSYGLRDLPEDVDWTEPHTPPNCLHSQIEDIMFTGFFWWESDMKVLKYLVDNARVLKEFNFNPYATGLNGEAAFQQEFLEYAKASSSSDCEVLFEDIEDSEWDEFRHCFGPCNEEKLWLQGLMIE